MNPQVNLIFHKRRQADEKYQITSTSLPFTINRKVELKNNTKVEESQKLQLSRRLQQLEDSLDSKLVKLTTFRKLLRRKLQQDNESRKSALHALIERIIAYPNRKMEVKFRIREKVEETHGGQDLSPHERSYPGGARMTRGGKE